MEPGLAGWRCDGVAVGRQPLVVLVLRWVCERVTRLVRGCARAMHGAGATTGTSEGFVWSRSTLLVPGRPGQRARQAGGERDTLPAARRPIWLGLRADQSRVSATISIRFYCRSKGT